MADVAEGVLLVEPAPAGPADHGGRVERHDPLDGRIGGLAQPRRRAGAQALDRVALRTCGLDTGGRDFGHDAVEHHLEQRLLALEVVVQRAARRARPRQDRVERRGRVAAQTECALRNVATALEATGERPEHLVETTVYVVGWEPSMLDELMRSGPAAREHVAFPETAVTLIGVQRLFTPGMLIEVEAVAVTPA